MKIPKIILLSFIFACIGITTEILFTSLSNVVNALISKSVVDWSLTGKTYLWMIFIYALIPFLLKYLNPFVQKFNIYIKAFLGVWMIYIIEFVSGFLLELLTGACPWEYKEGLQVMGYIRLDYFFFWYIFAFLIIKIYEILNERLQ